MEALYSIVNVHPAKAHIACRVCLSSISTTLPIGECIAPFRPLFADPCASDCAYKNIMMDATAMFPRGFHPVTDICLPDDITRFAPTLPRSKVPVTYYFVDFGLSSLFAADQASRLVTGSFGLDEEVPELSDEVPYDPFKVDIFILGNLFRQQFVEVRLDNPVYIRYHH